MFDYNVYESLLLDILVLPRHLLVRYVVTVTSYHWVLVRLVCYVKDECESQKNKSALVSHPYDISKVGEMMSQNLKIVFPFHNSEILLMSFKLYSTGTHSYIDSACYLAILYSFRNLCED